MGRIKLFFLFTISILIFSHNSYAQEEQILRGSVKTQDGIVLDNASVIIEELESSSYVTHTFTNKEGMFEKVVSLDSNTVYVATAQFLGFINKSITFSITDITNTSFEFILESNPTSLSEVIIKSEKPIIVKKDTIIFNAKSFSDGTEVVVEDLLKKIPGLNVDDEGTIKIGDKEVEKVMVDGDDFFEKGYKVLTKNLPASPIDKVELLQNFSNNKLLKNIEESNKVALNLTLNEDAKRQWFGNFDIAYDVLINQRYDARINLLNFGKKNKYYFFTNLNNVGYDATGDIDNLIRPSQLGDPGNIGNGIETNAFVKLSNSLPNFKRNRYNFNNAELVSLNAIFNPNERLKIKTIGFLNWDERDFFRNSQNNFISNNTDFINTENYRTTQDLLDVFGKLDIVYDISKKQTIESITRYSNRDENNRANRIFNSVINLEEIDSENSRFDHKTTYSNRFKERKAFLLTGRYINENSPQLYTNNQFLFQDIFPENLNANEVSQNSNQSLDFLGFEAHLLDRKEKGHLLELKLGNSYRNDRIQSTFLLINEDEAFTIAPEGFQNQTDYTVNDTYFNLKYSYALNTRIKLIGNIENHLINNQLSIAEDTNNQTVFYVNPSVGSQYEINRKNKITAIYGITRSNSEILNIYDQFAINNFRNFSKGTGTFNQIDASGLSLNYTLGNFSDKFFANASFIYSKSFDFFSTNSTVTQNAVLTERMLFEDSDFLSISTNVDRYFKTISSNIKLQFSYIQNNFKNIVNDSQIRNITTNNYNIGLELRSTFSGIFNYHLGTKWLINEIKTTFNNSFTDNISFLDLSFIFNKNLNFQIQTERYFFGNLQNDRDFYFTDIQGNYNIKQNKIALSLSARNLFNTDTFRNFSLNDLGSATTEYRLLPRYILLKLQYRF